MPADIFARTCLARMSHKADVRGSREYFNVVEASRLEGTGEQKQIREEASCSVLF